MKPAGAAFRTPGSTAHPSLGPRLKPGLASLSHQRTGLDTCKAGWAECLAQSASTEGIYPPPKAAAEVVGHNLPATDPMSRAGGCGGECGCGGNCGSKKTRCDCQHEVDYKIPGANCGCRKDSVRHADQSGHSGIKVIKRAFILPRSGPPSVDMVRDILRIQSVAHSESMLSHYAAVQHPFYDSQMSDLDPEDFIALAEDATTHVTTMPRVGCCCCAIDLKGDVEDLTEPKGPLYEVAFKLYGSTKMEKQVGASSQCTIEWWEWATSFPKGLEEHCKNGEWCEIYSRKDKIPDAKEFFKNFENRCTECEPEHICNWTLTDYPRYLKKSEEDWALVVTVILRSGWDCACARTEARYYFMLVIKGAKSDKPGIIGLKGRPDPQWISAMTDKLKKTLEEAVEKHPRQY